MYFGSIFIKEEIDAYPHISKKALTWSTPVTTPHSSTQLKEVAKTFHKNVTEDLNRLKLAGLLTSQMQGRFRLVAKNVYVYEHNEYTECGKVRLSVLDVCSSIEETVEVVVDGQEDEADKFLPFLYANPVLEMVYNKIMESRGISPQRMANLAEDKACLLYVKSHKSFRDGKDKCYTFDSSNHSYSEDTWSERLYYIIKILIQ